MLWDTDETLSELFIDGEIRAFLPFSWYTFLLDVNQYSEELKFGSNICLSSMIRTSR